MLPASHLAGAGEFPETPYFTLLRLASFPSYRASVQSFRDLTAGFPSYRISPCSGWRVFRAAVANLAEGGGFSEFPSPRAAISRSDGRFPELLGPRARVLGFWWLVFRVPVAICLHGDSESPKTCQRTPISVHDGSESRETRLVSDARLKEARAERLVQARQSIVRGI